MLEGAGGAAAPVGFFADGVETSEAGCCCFSFRLICWLWTHSKVHCLFVLTQFVHGPSKSGWSSVPGVVLVPSERARGRDEDACFLIVSPPAVGSGGLGECLWVKEYLHDSEWLGCPGPAGALQRRWWWPHRAPAGRGARRRRKLFYPSCTGRSWSSVAGSLSSRRHRAMCMCMCVSSCCEVAKAGRGDGVRRTSHLARGEFGREWNFADEHMTSTLASSWGKCRQAWPLDLSIAVPALSWLPGPAETQGGITFSQNTASALDSTAPHRARSDRPLSPCKRQ